MPVFEYVCAACGRVTEFLERADAAGEHRCEHCGGTDLKKAFSAFNARVAPQKRPSCDGCSSGGSCPMRQ